MKPMKLKYYIEFSETIENMQEDELESEELERVSDELTEHIRMYLSRAGFRLDNDEIKLEFDLEEL